MSEAREVDVRNAILQAIEADLEAGRTIAVDELRARYPPDLVAEELAALSDEPAGEERAEAGRVGPFRLLHELGRGGQGAVYLAVDTRLGRRVALKVLTGLALDSVSRLRFQREARVGSQLDDPVICTVHETGEALGTPYIAMRYVPGETLAARIARARDEDGRVPVVGSGRRDVVALVERVARALHRAHEAGVVHRDVKPGNVMVTPEGDPVLLDFGLAREADSSLAELTRTGDVFGTPAYMAPEQVAGHAAGPAADVHALGAVLFECLTLERPFVAPTREALERAVARDEPRDPARLPRGVTGDLRAILLTTLAKDPARRYPSAGELADDLARWRVGEPVLARPPTAWNRAARFVARHRRLVALTSAVVLVLGAATVVSTLALLDARAERATSVETLDAFEVILTRAAHNRAGRSVLLVEALDEARLHLEDRLARSPAAGARLIAAVGRVYTGLGEYASAQPMLERAVAMLREQYGPDHPATLDARLSLGVLHREAGRYDEAAEELEHVCSVRADRLGPGDQRTLTAELELGLLDRRRGDLERADEHFADVRSRAEGDLALDALAEIAVLRHAQGRLDEALEMHEEVARLTEEAKGPEHTDTAAAWNNLAVEYQLRQRLDEARALFEKVLVVYRDKYGPESPRTLVTRTNLAFLHKQRGDLDTAERIYREVLEAQERALDPDHPEVLNTLGNLGRLLQAAGRLEEAEEVLRRATAAAERRLDVRDAQRWTIQNNLGLVLQDRGLLDAAELELRSALEGREAAFGDEAPDTLRSVNNLAYLALARGREEEARELFERSLEGRRASMGPSHPDTVTAIVGLGWFHQQFGRLEEAARCYEEGVEVCRAEGEALKEVLPMPLTLLVRARAAQGRREEAAELARELVASVPEGHVRRAEAVSLLRSLEGTGESGR